MHQFKCNCGCNRTFATKRGRQIHFGKKRNENARVLKALLDQAESGRIKRAVEHAELAAEHAERAAHDKALNEYRAEVLNEHRDAVHEKEGIEWLDVFQVDEDNQEANAWWRAWRTQAYDFYGAWEEADRWIAGIETFAEWVRNRRANEDMYACWYQADNEAEGEAERIRNSFYECWSLADQFDASWRHGEEILAQERELDEKKKEAWAAEEGQFLFEQLEVAKTCFLEQEAELKRENKRLFDSMEALQDSNKRVCVERDELQVSLTKVSATHKDDAAKLRRVECMDCGELADKMVDGRKNTAYCPHGHPLCAGCLNWRLEGAVKNSLDQPLACCVCSYNTPIPVLISTSELVSVADGELYGRYVTMKAQIATRKDFQEETERISGSTSAAPLDGLTLMKPCCGAAFTSFTGCAAISCTHCPDSQFCAYCFEVIKITPGDAFNGNNAAHEHVRTCSRNIASHGDVFFSGARGKANIQMCFDARRAIQCNNREAFTPYDQEDQQDE